MREKEQISQVNLDNELVTSLQCINHILIIAEIGLSNLDEGITGNFGEGP
jgi:hypothetical protein